MTSKQLRQWHTTRQGSLVLGFAELVLAYVFGSLAIDSGSALQWIAAVILVFVGISNLTQSIRVNKNKP